MREAHILQATKTADNIERVIYFDSESEVSIPITDEEITRIEEGETVHKTHTPYLICSSFINRRTGSKKRTEYSSTYIKGKKNPVGKSDFTRRFWKDVAEYTTYTKKTYMFAHNCKYDIQVTGGITYLVEEGFEVVGYSDESPFVVSLEKYLTHSPRTGKMYGKLMDSEPNQPIEELDTRKRPFQLSNGEWFKPEPRIKKLEILSSTNYYAATLAKLGKVFGIEKLDFDHGEDFTLEKALTYCHVDVDILEAAVEGFLTFIERENLGGFSITVAGQAFKAFRHRFMEQEIMIHNDDRALEVERRAYSGGRTEVFRMNPVPHRCYYVDVNSMYPAVMRDEIFPVKMVSFWETATPQQIQTQLDRGMLICCDARVKVDKAIFPLKKERLLFPVGDFWTALSTPELKRALKDGSIIEVKNVVIYEGKSIFKPYVNYFYHARLDAKAIGDEIHDYLYKLFMNTLYGKFGQRNIKMIATDTAPADMIDIQSYYQPGQGYQTVKIFGGKVWEQLKGEESKEAYNSFPAIAAHVTAYARMKLWEAIETAGQEHVYYCDTDSLITDGWGYQSLWLSGLIDNKTLGLMKLEKTGDFQAFGVKDYIFHDEAIDPKTGKRFKPEIKIKGISKNARQLPTLIEGQLRFAVSQWGGFSTRLKNKDFTEYSNRVIIKTLKRTYNKGTIEGDYVKPFKFDYAAEQLTQLELFPAPKKQLPSEPYYELIKTKGHIKSLNKNDTYFNDYMNIKPAVRMRYFRNAKGKELNEWAKINGLNPGELIQELIKLNK